MKLSSRLVFLLASITCTSQASAGELFDLYQQSLNNDARFAVAKARKLSAEQSVPLALSGLLPKLVVNANYGRTVQENESLNFRGQKVTNDYRFNPENYSASIVQPIYRQANLANYWQSEWQVKQADASLDRSLDDLKARITQAYLQVLLSAARLELIAQQKKTYDKLRIQAQRSYESGYGTVTEMAESQSRLDELLSDEVAAQAAYDNRLSEVRNIAGNPNFVPKQLKIPAFKPDLHEGTALQDWLLLAKNQSPALKEQFARVKSAEYDVSKARAGYLPTVDLRLQYGVEKDPSYSSINYTNTSKSVMLSLNLPIFEGGQTLAQSRRSVAELTAAQESQRGVGDDISVSAEKEFGNVTSQAARIRALSQSVETNELLVKATMKSVDAGVRTNIDVLNAENQLFNARLKLTTSRIEYLQSLVNLRVVAGAVQDDELLKIDEVLH